MSSTRTGLRVGDPSRDIQTRKGTHFLDVVGNDELMRLTEATSKYQGSHGQQEILKQASSLTTSESKGIMEFTGVFLSGSVAIRADSTIPELLSTPKEMGQCKLILEYINNTDLHE